ncbi:hypothetical protein ES706_06444 [subsurface metagenome]
MAKIQRKWFVLTLYVAGLIGLSIGLTYLLLYLMAYFNISAEEFASSSSAYAYSVIFGVTLLFNASIMVPTHLHVPLMITAAAYWNPIIVVLVASIGGTLGEMTGYYAGYLGKRIVVTKDMPGYNRFVDWINRYGLLAIFLFSLQPILPFDIAGLTAGASRLPLWKFLLPCWAGRFLKYLVFCYFGSWLLQFLPLWSQPLG